MLEFINTFFGVITGVAGAYILGRDMRRKRETFHRGAALIVALVLIGGASFFFIYKPAVPATSQAKPSTGDTVKATTSSLIEPLPAGGSPIPQHIEEEVLVDLVNDTHRGFSPSARTFRRSFPAKAGYRIVSHRWSPSSVNNAPQINFIIGEGGRELILVAEIEAGPVVDRWRGWVRCSSKVARLLPVPSCT